MISIKSFSLQTLALFALGCLIFSGCASYHPRGIGEAPFMKRAETKEDGQVKVTVAALSSKESRKIFDVSLSGKGIQPVWIQIENKEKEPYIFLERSVNANYYTSEEAAYINHFGIGKQVFNYGVLSLLLSPALLLTPVDSVRTHYANKTMDGFFYEQGIHNGVVMPGETEKGFVYTPLDEGTKKVSVLLYRENSNKQFTFFVHVPGIKFDHMMKEFESLYSKDQIKDYDQNSLKDALVRLPPCLTNKNGHSEADPINLVIVGELDDLLAGFASAQWDQTEVINFKSAMKMVQALFWGKRYRYSPVSALYYKGRSQDLSLQKTRNNIAERLHLRLWVTPMRLDSKPVWIGSVSRDIGVKFTLKTWNLTTHKIGSHIDESRDYVLADLVDEEKVSRYGFVRGVGKSSRSKPRKNLTDDPYYTDGLRVVFEVTDKHTPLHRFDWEDFSEVEQAVTVTQ